MAQFNNHPKYDFQRKWLLSDSFYANTIDGQLELVRLNNMNDRWKHILKSCNGSPIGIQLAHKRNEDSFCHIDTSDEEGNDGVVLSYFDNEKYTMRVSYDSALDALATAVENGYWVIDKNALSRVSNGQIWRLNIAKAEILKAHKKGEISLTELVNRFIEIDKQSEVAA